MISLSQKMPISYHCPLEKPICNNNSEAVSTPNAPQLPVYRKYRGWGNMITNTVEMQR